jgi:hypothetical protein
MQDRSTSLAPFQFRGDYERIDYELSLFLLARENDSGIHSIVHFDVSCVNLADFSPCSFGDYMHAQPTLRSSQFLTAPRARRFLILSVGFG